jgi:DNA ligase (NAD+)
MIQDVADIYSLSKEDLLRLEGFADKKAENILSSIEASKQQSLARLITALGIRGVGEVGAGDLARRFHDLEKLRTTTTEDLLLIEGIGPNIAQAIVDWFANPTNQKVLKKLAMFGVWPLGEESGHLGEMPKSFTGQTFVITGTLPGLTRQEAKDLIESHGGKVTSSLSKKTSYLVLGTNPGSKLEKAQKLGIEILDEVKLHQLAG